MLDGNSSRNSFEYIVAVAQREHQELERGVALAFTDAIDCTLDLAKPVFNRGQRVGHRESNLIMAMHAPRDALGVGNLRMQELTQHPELRGYSVTDAVGNRDRGGTGGNRRIADSDQEHGISA